MTSLRNCIAAAVATLVATFPIWLLEAIILVPDIVDLVIRGFFIFMASAVFMFVFGGIGYNVYRSISQEWV